MEQQFEVENIKCGGCMNSIKTALLKIDGAENVIIDKDTDIIFLFGNVDRAIIIDKLNDLGYPEKGNNTLVRKAKSYVNCAIGRMTENN
ncbi:heavy-metal-associated domain-containing protein [Flavobacterium sp. 102]|uniref:heavy-metal-associated domain-containing protein n=1 Tax=Flavobacterium sp. 102 TaxID=2135623 RepID=UPI000EAE73DA|nr:heavy-metal-associated domain-containing protein [Flavobacterium sp. 102]RKS03471.1 copper chaperone CopZ [Flavobacterium sp. 102]